MFPMTITINTQDQLAAILGILGLAGNDAPKDVKKTEGKSKATTVPKADTVATPATAPATTEPAAPAPKVENSAPAAASETPPSYQDTATAITKLSRTKGRDAAVAVLAKFGVAKLPDAKPEQFADIVKAANEAMGG